MLPLLPSHAAIGHLISFPSLTVTALLTLYSGRRRRLLLPSRTRSASLEDLQRLPGASRLDPVLPLAHSIHLRGARLRVQWWVCG
jgi:hypothetical protein